MFFFGREREFAAISEFIEDSSSSGLMYLRGRRRIGKSALLLEVAKKHLNCFYFVGTKDSTRENLLKSFAREWDKFTGQANLSLRRTDTLDWSVMFSEVTVYARLKDRPTTIIIDEIQWVAKKGSGFLGQLKNTWQQWEETQRVKVILSGSSNKFFSKNVGGEEKILRGLRTRGDIVVPEFTLSEVSKFYFPQLSLEDVALVYFMLGGIPYYLQQLEREENNIIRIINNALFTEKTIFLDEVDEVLNLEFNKSGLKTVKRILSLIGQQGKTASQLVKITGLADSTLRASLEKLCDYQLLHKKQPYTEPTTEREIPLFMKDFYLNTYFELLSPLTQRIKTNKKGLLFANSILASESGYYIPNFSGRAFELLILSVLENFHNLKPNIFSKLGIQEVGYKLYPSFHKGGNEYDLALEHNADREVRLIEAKWANSEGVSSSIIKNFSDKKFTLPRNKTLSKHLIISSTPSAHFLEQAKLNGINVIGLSDLFYTHRA